MKNFNKQQQKKNKRLKKWIKVKVSPAVLKKRRLIKYIKRFDGLHESFWFKKLSNNLLKQGKKQTADKEVFSAVALIKRENPILNPLAIYIECLEKIKPNFIIKSAKVGGKKRDFPSFVWAGKGLSYSVRWLANLISSQDIVNHQRYLKIRIKNEVLKLYKAKNHSLLKHRESLFAQALKTRFNLRFKY